MRKILDPETAAEIEASFRRLAEEWKSETAPLSSIRRKKQHPAYRQLVELGEPAIPLILADLGASHRTCSGCCARSRTRIPPIRKLLTAHSNAIPGDPPSRADSGLAGRGRRRVGGGPSPGQPGRDPEANQQDKRQQDEPEPHQEVIDLDGEDLPAGHRDAEIVW